MPLHSGTLNTRLVLQNPTQTKNDDGGVVQGWSDSTKLWGNVMPYQGSEPYLAGQVTSDLSHIVVLRSDSVTDAITTRDRIRFATPSRTLNIQSIYQRGELHREIVLQCKEQRQGG